MYKYYTSELNYLHCCMSLILLLFEKVRFLSIKVYM